MNDFSPTKSSHPPAAQGGTPTRGKHILLVDDDPSVRGSLREVLESEGYRVTPAIDGQQAVECAAAADVDLVLLDLNMPRKNGWDAFEQLSCKHPLLPVIIVTARPNQLFTALGAGVGALLEKPFEIPTLLRNIRRLLAEPAATRLARLAGRETDFHYSAAQGRQPPESPAAPAPPPAPSKPPWRRPKSES